MKQTIEGDEGQTKAELMSAQKRLDKLARRAEPIETEMKALNHVLSEPPEEVTLAQLRALEERRNYLQQILDERWQELADAYKALAAAKEKAKQQGSEDGKVRVIV